MFSRLFAILSGAAMLLGACSPAAATTVPPVSEPGEATQPAAPAETVQIKVGVLNFMSNAPLFIALEDGFFAEQGLEVELISFGTSERDMIPAVLQGQIDVAAAAVNTSILNGIAQGSSARFVADKAFSNPEAECAADGWVVRKELLESGALDDLAALKGLKTTQSTGNMFEIVVDLLLEEAGLTRADIELVEARDQAARIEALGNGTLDLYAVSEPWISRVQASGTGDLWRPLSSVVPNYTIGTIIYGPSMLERDSDVGVRFMVAYLKAVEQFNQGKTDRNVEIVAGFTQGEPEEIRKVCWPSFQPEGKINTDGLTTFIEWADAKGYLEAPITVDQVWDPSFVEQANVELGR